MAHFSLPIQEKEGWYSHFAIFHHILLCGCTVGVHQDRKRGRVVLEELLQLGLAIFFLEQRNEDDLCPPLLVALVKLHELWQSLLAGLAVGSEKVEDD